MSTVTAAIQRIKLRDFFPRAQNIEIIVDDSRVYLPEQSWTKTYGDGLQKINFSGKNVLEVGVGCGVAMAGLMLSKNAPQNFIGTDISAEAIVASRRLASEFNINARSHVSDLLASICNEKLNDIDDIIACIPQVPMEYKEIDTTRELSDYYEITGREEDAYGLGLIARLLEEVRERAPHATTTLNIAGRPGVDRIESMFKKYGFKSEIAHEALVVQDAGTCLQSLVEQEKKTGIPFQFYADKLASTKINAAQAEEARLARRPLYHNLYVMSAKVG